MAANKSLSEVVRNYNYNISGYTFTIQRTARKDNFLSVIINENNKDYKESIHPKRTVFLTLKGAKKHALEMIENYKKDIY